MVGFDQLQVIHLYQLCQLMNIHPDFHVLLFHCSIAQVLAAFEIRRELGARDADILACFSGGGGKWYSTKIKVFCFGPSLCP